VTDFDIVSINSYYYNMYYQMNLSIDFTLDKIMLLDSSDKVCFGDSKCLLEFHKKHFGKFIGVE